MPTKHVHINLKHATESMLYDAICALPLRKALRLQAMLALYRGATLQQAADMAGVNKRTVWRWLKTWNAHGPDALTARKKGGRKPKMSRQDFDSKLLPLIMENGHEKSEWSLSEVRVE